MSKSELSVYDMKAEDKHIENVSMSSGPEKGEAPGINSNVDDYISKFLEMSEDARADD
ncbi:hypothetical protein CANMA_004440, partial [Candida margitis]|uniref:uncharacterized protein n=1 Tax=Candida margitis TaxID=1775924 RepID=UPI00222657AA